MILRGVRDIGIANTSVSNQNLVLELEEYFRTVLCDKNEHPGGRKIHNPLSTL